MTKKPRLDIELLERLKSQAQAIKYEKSIKKKRLETKLENLKESIDELDNLISTIQAILKNTMD